jgi:hypothetical protein
MTAIQRFKTALQACQIDEHICAELFSGYESLTDKAPKATRAAFFAQAIRRMDELLDSETCHAVREACACSKGGWRLKAVQKIAKDYAGQPLAAKIAALNQVTHLGKPVLNADGTLTAQIGEIGGFDCPCPVFEGQTHQPVSITYCYCCAGHFRFHYQIALGLKLKTLSVQSSALATESTEPCRFIYEVAE